ncbi:TraX family protein [Legionella tunisiensis]|uniref:TraX family protein n=1 Tax=Legionella tunisiensis TaxID=1034944 RepID=UPI0022B34F8C|nr:TraX family protein [Legionella tunisiensis]
MVLLQKAFSYGLNCLGIFCLLIARFNGNNWALASLPIILLATKLDLTFPRLPYFFYTYYPLHLTVLVLLSKYLGYR